MWPKGGMTWNDQRLYALRTRVEISSRLASYPSLYRARRRRRGGRGQAPDALCEDRVLDVRELEAREDAAGLEDAVRLGENALRVGAVAQAERDRVQVERVVGKAVEVLGVAEVERDLRGCVREVFEVSL